MLARWVTFLVWAGVAGSAVAWGLKIFVQPPAAPPQALVAETGRAAHGDLTRLLGVDPPAPVAATAPVPAADARFKLVGVVSPRSPQAAREGLALIAVDGKPPRAYRVGAVVDGAHVLQAVNPRGATLGPADGTALVALKLPPPSAAATGVLPPAGRVGAVPRPALSMAPLQAPAPASPISAGNEVQEVDDAEPTAPPERDSRATLR
jgi:general secretion pathway protein C